MSELVTGTGKMAATLVVALVWFSVLLFVFDAFKLFEFSFMMAIRTIVATIASGLGVHAIMAAVIAILDRQGAA